MAHGYGERGITKEQVKQAERDLLRDLAMVDKREKRGLPGRAKDMKGMPSPESGKLVDLLQSLTPKQRTFVAGLTQLGLKTSEAYRLAYDAGKMAKKTVHRRAVETRYEKGNVKAVIEGQQRAWTGSIQDAPEIRETSLRVLREIAEAGEVEACRVRSAELLGKVSTVGLFADRQEVTVRSEHSPEARAELQARLSSLLSGLQPVDNADVIDTTAVPSLGTDEDTGQG